MSAESFGVSSEGGPDRKRKKERKERDGRKAKLPLSAVVDVSRVPRTEPVESPLSRAFARLLAEQGSRREETAKESSTKPKETIAAEKEPEKKRDAEVAAPTPEAAYDTTPAEVSRKKPEAEETKRYEEEEELSLRELHENELWGGETVTTIDLTTPTEGLIDLDDETEPKTPRREHAAYRRVPEMPAHIASEAAEAMPTPQREQSVPVRSETPIAEPLTEASQAETPPPEGPPKPPTPPEMPFFEQPPEPAPVGATRMEPGGAYNAYAQYQAAARYTPEQASKVATKEDVDDAVYAATRTGLGRGLATGLVVGGAYEHYKHKRRERKAARRFKDQGRQLEKAQENQRFYFNEQDRRQFENDRRLAAAENRFTDATRRVEQYHQAGKQEPNGEQPAQTEVSEQLSIPPEHRLETSAWHSIEVDTRTGRPVEQPAFAYGHEYYRERAQESGPLSQRNSAAGEVALVAAAQANGGGVNGSAPMAAPVNIPSATMQGPPPSRAAAKADAPVRGPLASPQKASTGPLWPYLLALLVIVVCLIVLI